MKEPHRSHMLIFSAEYLYKNTKNRFAPFAPLRFSSIIGSSWSNHLLLLKAMILQIAQRRHPQENPANHHQPNGADQKPDLHPKGIGHRPGQQ
jgi:hypothetical protein